MCRGNLAAQHCRHGQGAPWVSAACAPRELFRPASGDRKAGDGLAAFDVPLLFEPTTRLADASHRRSFATVSHSPPQPPRDAVCCRVGSFVWDSRFFLTTEQRGTASEGPSHNCPVGVPRLPLRPSAQRHNPGDRHDRHPFRFCTSGQMGSENSVAGLRGTTNYWAPQRPARHSSSLGRPRNSGPPTRRGQWFCDGGPSAVPLLQPGSEGGRQLLWPLAARFLLPSRGNSGL